MRFLYGRMIDTMLATWGLSLLLVGLVTLIFGNTAVERAGADPAATRSAATRWAATTCSSSRVAALLMLGDVAGAALHPRRPDGARRHAGTPTWSRRSATIRARSTWRPSRSARRCPGWPAACMAPLTGVLPSVGGAYIAKAFITVITGGAAVIAGTLSTSALFGTVDQLVSFASTPVIGEIAMLALAAHPAAPDAAGHHRPLLPEVDMIRLRLRRRPHPLALARRPRRAACGAAAGAARPRHARRCCAIWALFALSLGADVGLCRHPVLRPGGVSSGSAPTPMRSPSINIGESTVPAAARDRRAGAGRRACIGAHDVLRPHQRRLSRRHHAHGHADPLQPLHERDRRRRLSHRQCAARRLQRHPGLSDPQRAGRSRRRRSTARPIYYVVVVCLLVAICVPLDPGERASAAC